MHISNDDPSHAKYIYNMLSVLIPTYQWDVSHLLDDLKKSMKAFNGLVEIIVCDDCSPNTTFYDDLITQFDHHPSISIIKNEKNLGRSRTRNRLIKQARGEWYIFIDGDSRIAHPENFLERYSRALVDFPVVVGGTLYDKAVPSRDLQLHWKYGKEREVKSAELRNRMPIRYFFSNNFGAHHSMFSEVAFDENIIQYGYEDHLWADQIGRKGHRIKHINNHVIHKGLKSNRKFVSDAESAVETLSVFYRQGRINQVYLLTFYSNQRRMVFGRFLLYLTQTLQTVNKFLLIRGWTTSLICFDLYRLGLLHKYVAKD